MQPKIIVLDDDPTGSQTVHSCLLLTQWDSDTLRYALQDESPLFFVLTNTRSVSPDRAAEITREVCRNLSEPLADYGRPWLVVSRSDSTLRGHYPVETDVLAEELGPFDAHFMTPAFFEGGRITKEGTHYVVRDGVATPAHETEFAKDSVFGYSTAYMPDYVEEKTAGRIRARDVIHFPTTLSDGEMLDLLRGLSGNVCCTVDTETQDQMDRFARLVLQVAGEGKRFLFRSAASLLTSLADLPPQPIAAEEMARYVPDNRPGLVVVGSHVPMSTRQLENIISRRPVEALELDVEALPDSSGEVEASLSRRLAGAHEAGRDAVLYTSRAERTFATPEERLAFGEEISRIMMGVIQGAPATLGFLISKGGITSNDVLSTGLGLKTARVVGQIHPGCSVVVTPETHRFGSIPVVIFPGNVGNDESITLVYDRFKGN
ncbi:MAG: four-carbon acid sugar kinase family protein [Spirochaetaceae bacterium]